MSQRKQRSPRPQQQPHPPSGHFADLRPPQALALPLAFTLLLAAFGVLPSVRVHPLLLWAFLGAAIALLAWNARLFVTSVRRGR